MAGDTFARPVLLLDGGLGTTLEEEHGVQFSNQTPLWSSHLLISSPETLLKAQTDFAGAGADVLLTATYQASFEGFSKTPRETTALGGGDSNIGYNRVEATKYMRSSISIARSAFVNAGRAPGLVALSLGAYGATMVPSQEYTAKYPRALLESDGLYDFHLDRITCFAEDEETWNNIDLVAFETLPRLEEIDAVRRVMGTVNSRAAFREFWISCVFPDGEDLPDGSITEDVVAAMLSDSNDRNTARPLAIGINCTKVHRLKTLIQNFESASQEQNLALPRLIIYPDGASGLFYDTATQKWAAREVSDSKDSSIRKSWHEEVGNIVREVRERGAWEGIIVGGCCKTTPAHIFELRKSLD